MLDNNKEFIFTVDLDDGTVMDFSLLGTFDVDGREYAAVMPMNGSDQIVFYRVQVGRDTEGNEGTELCVLKSDMEYEAVVDAFDSYIMDVSEY